jgi:hypothetical protein
MSIYGIYYPIMISLVREEIGKMGIGNGILAVD